MNCKHTKEKIQDAVNKSLSVANVLRELGVRMTGGSHSHIKKQIKKFKIDISHFTGAAWSRDKVLYQERLKPEEIFIKRPNSDRRQKHYLLKRALIESGIEYKCNKCGIKEWNGQSITLDVNHKNEDWLDDTKDNLEFLCPNCHSQYKK